MYAQLFKYYLVVRRLGLVVGVVTVADQVVQFWENAKLLTETMMHQSEGDYMKAKQTIMKLKEPKWPFSIFANKTLEATRSYAIAEIECSSGNHQEALKVCDESVRKFDGDPLLVPFGAYILLRLGGRYETALRFGYPVQSMELLRLSLLCTTKPYKYRPREASKAISDEKDAILADISVFGMAISPLYRIRAAKFYSELAWHTAVNAKNLPLSLQLIDYAVNMMRHYCLSPLQPELPLNQMNFVENDPRQIHKEIVALSKTHDYPDIISAMLWQWLIIVHNLHNEMLFHEALELAYQYALKHYKTIPESTYRNIINFYLRQKAFSPEGCSQFVLTQENSTKLLSYQSSVYCKHEHLEAAMPYFECYMQSRQYEEALGSLFFYAPKKRATVEEVEAQVKQIIDGGCSNKQKLYYMTASILYSLGEKALACKYIDYCQESNDAELLAAIEKIGGISRPAEYFHISEVSIREKLQREIWKAPKSSWWKSFLEDVLRDFDAISSK
jgi:hypothetical protein